MITIGICDDDSKMRKDLRQIMERTMQLEGVEERVVEYVSGEELLQATQPLDLLFLDIEMPGINGIDTAKQLREKQKDTVLVFVTAYPDFVFQGYDVHAFYYILKPFETQKIEWVARQALKQLADLTEQFFPIEQMGKTTKVSLRNIYALASEGRKILLYTAEETYTFYGKLSEVEIQLPDYFMRIHNRYLVNLHHIDAIEKEKCIVGKYSFAISRTYKQDIEVAFARELLR